jgi:hypothetical protein
MQTQRTLRWSGWSIGLFVGLSAATAVRPTFAAVAVARTSVVRAPAPVAVARPVPVGRPVAVAPAPVVVRRSVSYGPSPGAAVAATAVTAVAIGAVVASLPPQCSTVVTAGVTYQHCGGSWYRPRYSGSNVTYVVVGPP